VHDKSAPTVIRIHSSICLIVNLHNRRCAR